MVIPVSLIWWTSCEKVLWNLPPFFGQCMRLHQASYESEIPELRFLRLHAFFQFIVLLACLNVGHWVLA
jgi:hypothetical protein